MTLFSPEEEKSIADAITAAERKTSGEILAVVARASDTYAYVPVLVAALAALLVPWPFIYLTWHPIQWIYLIQLLTFAAIAALLMPMTIRMWFVPRDVARKCVHARAVEQFLVQNLHTTAGRTGVLIYVSLAERRAQIVADKLLAAKVPHDSWKTIIDALTVDLAQDEPTRGFVTAIEACGRLLAQHFPPGSADTNEFPNHLIVLR